MDVILYHVTRHQPITENHGESASLLRFMAIKSQGANHKTASRRPYEEQVISDFSEIKWNQSPSARRRNH